MAKTYDYGREKKCDVLYGTKATGLMARKFSDVRSLSN